MTPGEKLKSQLIDLSVNLWWAWNPHIIKLFRDLDPEAFRAANHYPFSVLSGFGPDRFESLGQDAALRARVDSAYRELREYLSATRTWASVNAGPLRVRPVAYFSAEFGIHESLGIYAGGLGILAGDHLKSASDLGLPLVAIGLLYREGYLRQRLEEDGSQVSEYPRLDFDRQPLELCRDIARSPLTVTVDVGGRTVTAQIWRALVGRVPLYLLDTDVAQNAP